MCYNDRQSWTVTSFRHYGRVAESSAVATRSKWCSLERRCRAVVRRPNQTKHSLIISSTNNFLLMRTQAGQMTWFSLGSRKQVASAADHRSVSAKHWQSYSDSAPMDSIEWPATVSCPESQNHVSLCNVVDDAQNARWQTRMETIYLIK